MDEASVLERSRPTGDMYYTTPPPNVQIIQNALAESDWNHLFPIRASAYTYQGFLQGAAYWPHFCSDAATCPMELAVMFSHMVQETGLNTPSQGELWRQGLYHLEEMCAATNSCPSYADWSNSQWPAQVDRYYGRGAKQLSWNYNYGPYSLLMTGDKMTFLNNPDLVIEPEYAISSAIWFYMTPQNPKPSMHDVVTGCWNPSADDLAAGRTAASQANIVALTTHIINGGIECSGGPTTQASKRFQYYLNFAEYFGLPDRPTSMNEYEDCANIGPFDASSTGAGLMLYYAQDWANTQSCGCKLVSWQSGYFRTLDMLDECEQDTCGYTGGSDCSVIGSDHGWMDATGNSCGGAGPVTGPSTPSQPSSDGCSACLNSGYTCYNPTWAIPCFVADSDYPTTSQSECANYDGAVYCGTPGNPVTATTTAATPSSSGPSTPSQPSSNGCSACLNSGYTCYNPTWAIPCFVADSDYPTTSQSECANFDGTVYCGTPGNPATATTSTATPSSPLSTTSASTSSSASSNGTPGNPVTTTTLTSSSAANNVVFYMAPDCGADLITDAATCEQAANALGGVHWVNAYPSASNADAGGCIEKIAAQGGVFFNPEINSPVPIESRLCATTTTNPSSLWNFYTGDDCGADLIKNADTCKLASQAIPGLTYASAFPVASSAETGACIERIPAHGSVFFNPALNSLATTTDVRLCATFLGHAQPFTTSSDQATTSQAMATSQISVGIPSSIELHFLQLINTQRAQGHTCPDGTYFPPNPVPLKFDCLKFQASELHSIDMFTNNYMDHTGLDGSSPWDRVQAVGGSATAENLAMGVPSAAAVLNGWNLSNGHCLGEMQTSHKSMGVGFYNGYWTALYGDDDIGADDCLPPTTTSTFPSLGIAHEFDYTAEVLTISCEAGISPLETGAVSIHDCANTGCEVDVTCLGSSTSRRRLQAMFGTEHQYKVNVQFPDAQTANEARTVAGSEQYILMLSEFTGLPVLEMSNLSTVHPVDGNGSDSSNESSEGKDLVSISITVLIVFISVIICVFFCVLILSCFGIEKDGFVYCRLIFLQNNPNRRDRRDMQQVC